MSARLSHAMAQDDVPLTSVGAGPCACLARVKRLLALAGAAGLLGLACSQPAAPVVAITPVLPTAEPTALPPRPTIPPPRPPAAPTATPAPPNPTPDTVARLAREVAQADATFSQGHLRSAAGLYARALQGSPDAADPRLRRLRAFARLRLGLAQLLDRAEEQARQVLQEEFRAEPDEAFRQMAFQLWDTYAMTGDAVAACARVGSFALERGVRVELGPGASVEPREICQVPAPR